MMLLSNEITQASGVAAGLFLRGQPGDNAIGPAHYSGLWPVRLALALLNLFPYFWLGIGFRRAFKL